MHLALRAGASVVLAAAAALAARSGPALSPQDDAERSAWLAGHATVLRTLDPTDPDDSDLLPIVAAIGTARIVVLGEASHEDGATFRAKCRLVRFLQERMGFDVLAWEAGFLDCERMNEALSADGPLQAAKESMMRNGWDASAECDDVFSYARASWGAGRPLIMTGFDGGRLPHGPEHVRTLVASLVERVPGLGGPGDAQAALALARRGYGYMSAEHAKLPDEVRARERGAIEALLARIEHPSSPCAERLDARERAAAAESLRTLLVSERGAWLIGRGMLSGEGEDMLRHNKERDAEMARMLLWLAEERYRDRKLIVWCATSHMIRGLARVEPLEPGWSYAGLEQMGDHVASAIGDEVYVIAFTAFGGEIGVRYAEGDGRESAVRPIDPPARDDRPSCPVARPDGAALQGPPRHSSHWTAVAGAMA
jgi:erythromycin esterase